MSRNNPDPETQTQTQLRGGKIIDKTVPVKSKIRNSIRSNSLSSLNALKFENNSLDASILVKTEEVVADKTLIQIDPESPEEKVQVLLVPEPSSEGIDGEIDDRSNEQADSASGEIDRRIDETQVPQPTRNEESAFADVQQQEIDDEEVSVILTTYTTSVEVNTNTTSPLPSPSSIRASPRFPASEQTRTYPVLSAILSEENNWIQTSPSFSKRVLPNLPLQTTTSDSLFGKFPRPSSSVQLSSQEVKVSEFSSFAFSDDHKIDSISESERDQKVNKGKKSEEKSKQTNTFSFTSRKENLGNSERAGESATDKFRKSSLGSDLCGSKVSDSSESDSEMSSSRSSISFSGRYNEDVERYIKETELEMFARKLDKNLAKIGFLAGGLKDAAKQWSLTLNFEEELPQHLRPAFGSSAKEVEEKKEKDREVWLAKQVKSYEEFRELLRNKFKRDKTDLWREIHRMNLRKHQEGESAEVFINDMVTMGIQAGADDDTIRQGILNNIRPTLLRSLLHHDIESIEGIRKWAQIFEQHEVTQSDPTLTSAVKRIEEAVTKLNVREAEKTQKEEKKTRRRSSSRSRREERDDSSSSDSDYQDRPKRARRPRPEASWNKRTWNTKLPVQHQFQPRFQSTPRNFAPREGNYPSAAAQYQQQQYPPRYQPRVFNSTRPEFQPVSAPTGPRYQEEGEQTGRGWSGAGGFSRRNQLQGRANTYTSFVSKHNLCTNCCLYHDIESFCPAANLKCFTCGGVGHKAASHTFGFREGSH